MSVQFSTIIKKTLFFLSFFRFSVKKHAKGEPKKRQTMISRSFTVFFFFMR